MRADSGDLLDGMGAHAIAAGGGVDVVAHADTGFVILLSPEIGVRTMLTRDEKAAQSDTLNYVAFCVF